MTKFAFLCVSLILVLNGSQAKVVPFLNPCHLTDSDCILESAKTVVANIIKGYEPLGVPSIDPLEVKDFKVDGDLQIAIENAVVHNLAKCTLNKITRDPAQSTINVNVDCPIHVVGNYEAHGKLLFVEVEGKGPFEVKGDKMHIDFTVKLEKIMKDGKEFYKIKNYEYKYEPKSKFVMRLDNLFNGDQAKAEPINNILKDNTNTLLSSDGVGKPIVRKVLKTLVKLINGVMEVVPVDEIEIA